VDKLQKPDLVQAAGLVRQMRQRIHIDPMFEGGDRGRHTAGPDLQQIGTARDERPIAHPDHMRGELVDEFGWFAARGDKVAARHIDLVLEGQCDGVAFLRAGKRAVEGGDLFHSGRAAGARDEHAIPRGNGAGDNSARKAAKLAIRPVDPLHGKTERPCREIPGNLDGVEVLEQRRAAIPRQPGGQLGDVVAQPRRDRDHLQRGIAEILSKGRKAGCDFRKAALVESDEIHLVDRKDHMADAEQ